MKRPTTPYTTAAGLSAQPTGCTKTLSGIYDNSRCSKNEALVRMKCFFHDFETCMMLTVIMLFSSCINTITKETTTAEQEDEFERFFERSEIIQDSILRIPKFDDLLCDGLKQRYFRMTTATPFNGPIEIIDLSEDLFYGKYTFDTDCHIVESKKPLTDGCFEVIDSFNSELTIEALDSLYELLKYIEFWNLSTNDVTDSGIIYDGEYVMVQVAIADQDLEGNILTRKHRIQREEPKRYLGMNLLIEYVRELEDRSRRPDNMR